MTDLPVLILIVVYTETNRKVLIKLLLKKSGTQCKKIAGSFRNYIIMRTF